MAMPSHPSLLFMFITLTLTHFSTATQYLKLPLLPPTTLPSASNLLAADLRRLTSPINSGAATGSGQYFAELRLGSPPQRLLLVADTGSDLLWVKCSACRNCSAHPPGSAFLPRHSSSFSSHHCYDSPCQLVPHPRRCNNRTKIHTPCRYKYSYADASTTTGFFSTETTTFNTSSKKQSTLKNLSFGCAFKISGPSVTGSTFNGAQGVMGLGRGPISFTSQLAREFGNTFSYCLLDYTLSPPPVSYLTIGNDVVSRNVLTYTPLLTNPISPSFYYVSVESVSVDAVKLPIPRSVWAIDADGNGGAVVDSGTTLTFLAEPAYRHVLAAFRRRVMMCLAVQPVRPGSGFSVIGNLMQQGYLFAFDLDRSRIGFSRHGCAVR
ncbi:aspartyl protease family protein 2 [Cajanus cajan]|uniref:aspartyl protease family protein 2 n=1 Tax=Cajanus cajan TaxID=3821 RepID=UPI00098DB4FE|nr:aspartyl protease family protein 2 [Cajanus cajan]